MKIEDLTSEIDKGIAAYRAKYETGSRAELHELNEKVVALQAQRSKAIAEGCSVCPSCGESPIGLPQSLVIGGEVHEGFEIGCPNCLDHRAKSTDLAAARALWEKGPTVPEQKDKNGSVIKRAERGWIVPNGRTIERDKDTRAIVTTTASGAKINWSERRSLVERRRLSAAARAETAAPKPH